MITEWLEEKSRARGKEEIEADGAARVKKGWKGWTGCKCVPGSEGRAGGSSVDQTDQTVAGQGPWAMSHEPSMGKKFITLAN